MTDWRRKADHYDAQAEQLAVDGHIAEAGVMARKAQRLRELADEVERGLTGANKARNVTKMAQAAPTEAPRRRGKPTQSKHPFPVALALLGSDVATWAEDNGYKRRTVQNWFSETSPRPIPAAAADLIQEQMGKDDEGRWRVPATKRTWKNGIRSDRE